jgi:hypothetical protein
MGLTSIECSYRGGFDWLDDRPRRVPIRSHLDVSFPMLRLATNRVLEDCSERIVAIRKVGPDRSREVGLCQLSENRTLREPSACFQIPGASVVEPDSLR